VPSNIDPFAETPKSPRETPVVNIPRGGAKLVQVNAVRRGYTGPIQLFIPETVEGITAEGGLIAEGANDGFLFVSAAADAPLHAFDLEIWGQGGPVAQPLKRQAVAERTNPYAFIDAVPARVPAAISEAPPVTVTVDQRTMRIAHGQTQPLRVTARRTPAATGPITVSGQGIVALFLQLTPATIAEDSDSVTLNLKPIADPNLVAPRLMLPLVAKTTVDGREETIELAPVQLELGRPYKLEPVDSAPVVAAPGNKTRLAMIVRRQPPFEGAVRLAPAPGSGLPPHVSLNTVEVSKEETLALLELDVRDEAAPGEFDLPIRASTKLGDSAEAAAYAIPDTIVRVRIPPRAP
jgi:hypothetical protein